MATERNKVLDKDYSDDFGTVTIKFLESGEVLTVNVSALSIDVQHQAICHGLVQKLGDAAAGKAGDEAYDAVMGVYERIAAGEWSKAREASGPRPTLVAEAVMRVATAAGKYFDRDAIIAKFAGKDGAEGRKAAMARADVAQAYEQLRREAADARLAKRAAEQPVGDIGALL